VGFRNTMEVHAADPPRAELWRTIYRTQVQLLAHNVTGVTENFRPFQITFNLLVKKATNYDPSCHDHDMTMDYLLLSTDYYLRSFGMTDHKRSYFARISESYGLAAQAQVNLSSLTYDDYDPAEDVSITVVRMRLDRHLFVARSYDEAENDQVMLQVDFESILKIAMLQTVRQLISHETTCFETSLPVQKEAMVWENLVAKEVFTRYLPQIAHLCEHLPNYGVVLSEQQLASLVKLTSLSPVVPNELFANLMCFARS